MRLDLSEIARTVGMTASQDIEEPCSPDEMGFHCTSPVKGSIRFNNTGTLLLVNGEIHTEVQLECGRCVTDYIQKVDAPIEEEFRIEQVGDSMQVLPLDEEDAAADFVKNNILDLTELIRQNVLLALPIQPLCDAYCKGLCPTCGENLNVRQCECPPQGEESPFAALADLLQDEDEK